MVAQVHPIKPTLNGPGTKRLKLRHLKLLSIFAFKFILRRYNKGKVPWNKVGQCRLTLLNPR